MIISYLSIINLRLKCFQPQTPTRQTFASFRIFPPFVQVFATGNFKAIADTLASMKRSLALLGDVPEFRGSQGRMMVLEDRLHSAVEARLSAVLSDRSSGPAVRDLIEVLKSIQRLESVSRLYIAARLPTLRAGWDAYSAANEPRPVADWIEGFYEGALEILQLEAQWYVFLYLCVHYLSMTYLSMSHIRVPRSRTFFFFSSNGFSPHPHRFVSIHPCR